MSRAAQYVPKHRRCTRKRHHVWTYGRPGLMGMGIVRCTQCGYADLWW